jgi:hypothetical protein
MTNDTERMFHDDAEDAEFVDLAVPEKSKSPIAVAQERIEAAAADAGIVLADSEARLFATLLILIRQREDEAEVLRFPGQPHARFFRFIGKRVATPDGIGVLAQAFADRLAVRFERSYKPDLVEPLDELAEPETKERDG